MCPTLKSSLVVNFMISIIVHLPLRGCQLRCYFFNEYNWEQFPGQMKGIVILVWRFSKQANWNATTFCAKEEAKMAKIIRHIYVYCL